MSDTISYTLKTTGGQILSSLAHICRKAAAHAKTTETEETNFLNARLYPDMFEMKRQVQVATDIFRRGSYRLVGGAPESVADEETSFEELAKRCEEALATVMAHDDAALNADPESIITLETPRGDMKMPKREFLQTFMLPNLIFHASMAYALLRMQGVDVGKMDFLASGNMPG